MKVNKRELALLERAFAAEIQAALEGGPGLIQPKGKLIDKLVADGLLCHVSETLSGHPPITLRGYELTHLGRFVYCSAQPPLDGE